MATYGKKKRSILPSFASLRDVRESDSAPMIKKKRSKLRVSKSFIKVPFLAEVSRQYQPRDDSIEEMASMLLDDTTMDQLNTNTEPGRRLSQTAAAEIFNNFGRMNSVNNNNLPQLPQLVFDGDDAWAMKNTPMTTDAEKINQMSPSGDTDPLILPSHSINHSRKGSAPAIPRKSSKRQSERPKKQLHTLEKKAASVSRELPKTKISPPKQIDLASQNALIGVIDINEKVQAMLAATKALKGDDGSLLPGPLVPPRKRRFADYKVLTKMKTAINDRLQGINSRRKRTVQHNRLLDDIGDEGGDVQEDMSVYAAALTTMRIRVNEGTNFKNPKTYTLTGHGSVPRKPLADEGKSLGSRKSLEDPFSEPPQSSSISRMPTSFEVRLRDDMSIDESRENSQELSNGASTPRRDAMNLKHASVFTDFDAILSSSPVAQSTPRIRLEPSFGEGGKRILKNVPLESRSVFDFEVDNVSDMELDDASSRKTSMCSPIRKKSQAKRYSGVGLRGHGSKRVKKHPSPSKADLEVLEHAMRDFPRVSFGEEVTPASGALAPRDANMRVNDSKRRSQIVDGELKGSKLEFVKTTDLTPSITSHKLQQQAQHNGFGSRRSNFFDDLADNNNLMDMDELQWDQTAYRIGMRTDV